MRIISVGFVLAVWLASAVSLAEEKNQPTINTAGEAVVYVEPDEVVFQFGVETRDQSLDKAESLNDDAAAKLITAVKKLGVEDKDISTAQLNVQLLYPTNGDIVISGYAVNRAYSICLKDPKKFQTLVDSVLKNGGNRINGFEFRTTQLRKYRDQARAMAIKAALEKAQALAGELKCAPGNPRAISETGGSWGYCGNSNAVQVAAAAEEGDGGLPLGRIEVRANVNATFDLVLK